MSGGNGARQSRAANDPAELFNLANRKALITGGSRGLGLQIAEALGAAGAELVISARKSDELDAAVTHLAALGITAHAETADVGDPQAAVGLAERAVKRFGQLDILVNNAGASWGSDAADLPLHAWQKLINVNMTGAFLLSQRVGQLCMIERNYGRILNVASIAGLRGNPPGTNNTLAYNTTKGGLINFTRALAGEWGQYNITVNALAPGFFPSRMSQPVLNTFEDKVRAMTPLQRIGDDQDLKGASLLFCSDAGKHITGQILAIDGGISAV